MFNLATKFKRHITTHEHKWLTVIISFFAILYSIISIVPHYNFQTTAWDLGLFNQTIYQYAHLSIAPNTIRNIPTLLGDHFEVIMFIFAPFYWLFGSYTLLVFQIIAILCGGLGIFQFIKHKTRDNLLAFGGLFIFFFFYGNYTALAYDYHNNVIGIMLLPWMLYALEKKKITYYYILLGLFLLAKENLSLITLFLGLSLIIFEKKKLRFHGLITAIISLAYFILVIKVIIPFFLRDPYTFWNNYQQYGNGPWQALLNILSRPTEIITASFNHPLKLLTWKFFLTSGGFLVFFYPRLAILLIPLFAQKFLSQTYNHWGTQFQYSVEFSVIVAISAPIVLRRIRYISAYFILTFIIFINLSLALFVPFNEGKHLTQIFTAKHYWRQERVDIIKAKKLIPKNAPVTAQNTLVPHVANRAQIYEFPKNWDGSDYIFLNINCPRVLPLTYPEYLREIEKIKKTNEFDIIYDQNKVLLFKRIGK